ncbi:hypothetical protein NDU88_010513 [Pleurodeles waltl]|uniref:Uncharacterized protein n=1 Tax=Pleurodeles waltl TaxID=8319 RepID=A0AAV7RZ87_PLEWA|nr:hypothetical protein NDU88_010513 [Pleurodeles waltl]
MVSPLVSPVAFLCPVPGHLSPKFLSWCLFAGADWPQSVATFLPSSGAAPPRPGHLSTHRERRAPRPTAFSSLLGPPLLPSGGPPALTQAPAHPAPHRRLGKVEGGPAGPFVPGARHVLPSLLCLPSLAFPLLQMGLSSLGSTLRLRQGWSALLGHRIPTPLERRSSSALRACRRHQITASRPRHASGKPPTEHRVAAPAFTDLSEPKSRPDDRGGHFGAAASNHETETSNRPRWFPDISSRMLLATGHVSTDLEAQSGTAKAAQRPDRV